MVVFGINLKRINYVSSNSTVAMISPDTCGTHPKMLVSSFSRHPQYAHNILTLLSPFGKLPIWTSCCSQGDAARFGPPGEKGPNGLPVSILPMKITTKAWAALALKWLKKKKDPKRANLGITVIPLSTKEPCTNLSVAGLSGLRVGPWTWGSKSHNLELAYASNALMPLTAAAGAGTPPQVGF